MYNLNMSGSAAATNLLNIPQGEASSTPRTPEILNSLIAMSNPFDSYRSASAPRLASSPPGGSDTTSSSSGSPSCVSPPSVQHTCSQLIKEGLKLTIQTKRRQTERTSTSTNDDDDGTKVPRRDEVSRDSLGDDDDDLFSTGEGLTPEDEERRRRRRERNKIAATKCRLKKRERTVNLVQESEILENQNHDLKSQIQELETQRRRLVDMLSIHRPSCTKQQYNNTAAVETSTSFPSQSFTYPRATSTSSMYTRVNIASYTSRPTSTSAVESTMAYRRMEMSECKSTAGLEPTYQRLETTVEENSTYCRPGGTLLQDVSYHNFDEQVIKDPSIMLVPYCKANTVDNPTFLRMSSDQYTCQSNLTDLDHSLEYIKPEAQIVYQRPASTFGRPISVDINTPVSPAYDSHPEGLDSPSIAPNTYQHFEDSSETTFTAGFATSGIA